MKKLAATLYSENEDEYVHRLIPIRISRRRCDNVLSPSCPPCVFCPCVASGQRGSFIIRSYKRRHLVSDVREGQASTSSMSLRSFSRGIDLTLFER